MTRPASGAACPLSSTRRRSMYQLARCPDDSTKSPCTTAFSLITRSRSSRSLTVGEPTQRPPRVGAQAVPALGRAGRARRAGGGGGGGGGAGPGRRRRCRSSGGGGSVGQRRRRPSGGGGGAGPGRALVAGGGLRAG